MNTLIAPHIYVWAGGHNRKHLFFVCTKRANDSLSEIKKFIAEHRDTNGDGEKLVMDGQSIKPTKSIKSIRFDQYFRCFLLSASDLSCKLQVFS